MVELTVAPKFSIDQTVKYFDRQQRLQTGRVHSIEARWDQGFPEPLVMYRLSHPTYRNRTFYAVEAGIVSESAHD